MILYLVEMVVMDLDYSEWCYYEKEAPVAVQAVAVVVDFPSGG